MSDLEKIGIGLWVAGFLTGLGVGLIAGHWWLS